MTQADDAAAAPVAPDAAPTPQDQAAAGAAPVASETPAEAAPAEGTPTPEKPQDEPQAPPESYTFTAPDGLALDSGVTDAFAGVAKELGLSQDAAQKLVATMAPVMAQRQSDSLQAQRTEWREQAVADKDFGGDKLTDNLAAARRARDAFASPELTQLLEQTGLGDHPEVIRLFVKTGKAMSEDGLVSGRATGATRDARSIYSASNMNP